MTKNSLISPVDIQFCYKTRFNLLKQSQRSRSTFLGLFWKEKKFSYNRRNMVVLKVGSYIILNRINLSMQLYHLEKGGIHCSKAIAYKISYLLNNISYMLY